MVSPVLTIPGINAPARTNSTVPTSGAGSTVGTTVKPSSPTASSSPIVVAPKVETPILKEKTTVVDPKKNVSAIMHAVNPKAKVEPVTGGKIMSEIVTKAETDAYTKRIEDFKKSDFYKDLTNDGKQVNIAMDGAITFLTEGVPNFVKGFLGGVTKTDDESESLANFYEYHGFKKQAEDIRVNRRVDTINDLSNQEILDLWDKPSAAREITRLAARELPGVIGSFRMAAAAGFKRAALKVTDTAKERFKKEAYNEIIPTLIYSYLTRDPNSSFSEQLVQGTTNLALLPATAGAGSVLFQQVAQVGKSRIQALITKSQSEGLTEAEKSLFLEEVYLQNSFFGENRLIAKTGGKTGREGIDISAEPPNPNKLSEYELSLLDKVATHLKPKKEPITVSSIIKGAKETTTKFKETFISKYVRLGPWANEIQKNAGLKGDAKILKDFTADIELTAGAAAKAEVKTRNFEKEIVFPINRAGGKPAENYDSFLQWLFLNRTVDRLKTMETISGPRDVGDWTLESSTNALSALKKKLGAEKTEVFKIVDEKYQKIMDDSLREQIKSGRMSLDVYEEIKRLNKYYAPFKVQHATEEAYNQMSAGLITKGELTKKIKGILDEDFVVDDILQTSIEQIYRGTILAEKNIRAQRFLELADLDPDQKFIVRMEETSKRILKEAFEKFKDDRVAYDKYVAQQMKAATKGMDTITVYKDGVPIELGVPKEIAKAVKGMNAANTEIVMNGYLGSFLRKSKRMASTGITTLNLSFQSVNFPLDIARLMTTSKAGLKITNPKDYFQFVADYGSGLYSSFKKNIFKNFDQAALDTINMNALNSTMESYWNPKGAPSVLRPAATTIGKSVKEGRRILETASDVANALEETHKLVAFGRMVRDINKKFGLGNSKLINENALLSNPRYKEALLEAGSDTRRYGGSPDFFRGGFATPVIGLLFLFLNARIQGMASDFDRLVSKIGTKDSMLAWGRLAAVNTPVLINAVYNEMYNREKMDGVTEQERKNYIMIFTGEQFINKNGAIVDEAYRFPKRQDGLGFMANFIETSVRLMFDKDPKAAAEWAAQILEGYIPLNVQGGNLQEKSRSLMSNFTPPIKLLFEGLSNVDTFTKRQIVPDYLIQSGRDAYKMYDPTNPPSDISLVLSKFLHKQGILEVSPIMLDHQFEGYTGGFFSQFKTGDLIEGRSIFSVLPITKRFFRTPYVNEEALQDLAIEHHTKYANYDANIDNLAFEKIKEWEALPPDEADKLYNELKTYASQKGADKDTKELFEAIDSQLARKLTSMSAFEWQFGKMGIESGERAAFLLKLMTQYTKEGKAEEFMTLWKRLQDIKLINKNVSEQYNLMYTEKVNSLKK